MKETSEKYIERKLVQGIQARGGLCIKLICDQMTGLPDRLCLLPRGLIYFVEVKSTGKKPRKIQKAVHAKLKELGFKVIVIDSMLDLDLLFNSIDVYEREQLA